MPTDFIIDTRRGMVFSKTVGKTNHIELADHLARLRVHPDFRPHFDQLFDLRESVPFEVSSYQVAALAQHQIFSPTSRRAALVSSDLQYGLCRIFETYRDLNGEPGVRTFRDAHDALGYLGIDALPPTEAFANLIHRAG